MPTHEQIFWAFMLPAAIVAAMALLPLGRFGSWRSGLTAIAIAGGFALGYWHDIQTPGSPVADVKDWLFYATIPLALLALGDTLFRPPLWLIGGLLLIFFRLAVRAILYKQIPGIIDPSLAEFYIDLISLIAVSWWLCLETLAMRLPGPTVPLVLGLIAAGAAAALIAFPSFQNAPLAGSISLMLVIVGAVGFFRRDLTISRGPVLVVTSLLLLLMTHGFFYSTASDTFDPHALALLGIMLAAPFAAMVGDLPVIRNWPNKLRLPVRLVAVALMISVVAPKAIKDIEDQLHPERQMMSE